MKQGKSLENFVKCVYEKLLELNDYKHAIVSTNVIIKGMSGSTNEFDIFYEYRHLNIDCRVVIECKDWKNKVEIKEIRDFSSKIQDIGFGNTLGIFISKSGFQSGCETFAKSQGIKLLTVDELPKMNELIAGIIEKGFLPDESEVGDPFWTIMEIKNGNVTGTYLSIENTLNLKRPTIPLFFSPKLASVVINTYIDKDNYCIRGVSQYQLKKLLDIHVIGNVQYAVFLPVLLKESATECPCVIMEAEDIENIFYRD